MKPPNQPHRWENFAQECHPSRHFRREVAKVAFNRDPTLIANGIECVAQSLEVELAASRIESIRIRDVHMDQH
ncbi:hypothetical protein D6833_08625, partial [Candidatus Parcubacteria bacterium]